MRKVHVDILRDAKWQRGCYLFTAVLCLGFVLQTNKTYAQISCPPNIDFEYGNFTNWFLDTGNCCPINTPYQTGALANRHVITSGTGTDPYGGFPIVCPGGTYSLKLGNDNVGSQAERARYYVHVPAGASNYHLIYRYAVVFEDPNHTAAQQPRFEVRGYDSTTGNPIPCAQFTYVASSNLPGFAKSSIGTDVYYKSWSTASINLTGYAGKTVIISFATGDCALGAHFGYGYVDPNCALFQISSTTCSPTASLTAPSGFLAYKWMDSSFTTTYATTQTAVVNTPLTTRKYAVILTPFTGFGCVDTFYATVTGFSLTANTINDTLICSNDSIQLSTSIVGTTPPYTYSWSPSTGLSCTSCVAPIAKPLTTTKYYVTVTDSNGCSNKDSVTITIDTRPVVGLTQTNVLCNGGATGTITALASGSYTPFTYSWNTVPVKTTAAITALPIGSYTITVKDNKGCTSVATTSVSEPPLLTGVATNSSVLCYGNSTATASVAASGGIAPYTYLWNTLPLQTTAAISNLIAGTYIVTVKDSNNCVAKDTVVVKQPLGPLNAVISASANVSCYSGNNGTATVSASGGTPPYTYSWNTSPAQTSATAINLTAGIYTVTVTDSNGCTKTVSDTITQPVLLNAVATKTDASCYGGNNGTATVVASGGSAPYSYSWNTSPVQTTATATSLAASTYTVTVTDTKGCIKTTTAVISQPAALNLSTSKQDVACYGSNNGTATVTVSGGSFPYTYSWNSTPVQTTPTATGLPAGTYTVTVTDAHNCSQTAAVTISQPTDINITVNKTDVSCYGDSNGTASAIVSGGTLPYSYSWNTTPVQTTAGIANLASGFYVITVTDGKGCTKNGSVTIIEPLLLTASTTKTDVGCFGGSNGTATVNVTGGTSPYTYIWNTTPVQTGATAVGLSAGTYSVTVTDSKGCTTLASAIITQPNVLAATMTKTDVNCFGGNNGTATVTASGGSLPYTYAWNTTPIQTTSTATNLAAGTYVVTVTDANGCIRTATATVAQPSQLTASLSGTNTNCSGSNNGTATVVVSGGVALYTYSWNTTPAQTSATATGLGAGSYTVTVTDANGCIKTATTTVSQPTTLNATVNKTDVTCFGLGNGTATVAATGGTGPYSYSWNTTPVKTTATINNLAPGTYIVTVTDSKGCSTPASITILEPAVLSASTTKTDVSCYNGNNGTASVTVTGGNTPYTYSWNTTPIKTTATITGLTAGTYTVTVTDIKGCTKTAAATIGQPTSLTASIATTNLSCNNSKNGSATVTAAGGTAPYSYSWNTVPVQTTATITNMAVGTYIVTVTDSLGCTRTATAIITQPAAIIANTGKSDVNCFGGGNGIASVSVAGGTAPYSYAWNTAPVQTTATASNLVSGVYMVVITDANGCKDSAMVTISQPALLSVTLGITDVTCYGYKNGGINTSVNGGTAPYTYQWNTVPIKTKASIANQDTGYYSVTVTDAKGCTVTASDSITQPLPLTISAEQIKKACPGISDGAIRVSFVSGGTMPYSYSWNTNPNQTSDTVVGLASGVYTVTVKDANFCIESANVSVENYPTPVVDAGTDKKICPVDSVQLFASGASSYTWSPSIGLSCVNCQNPIAFPKATTTYQVIGVDENNCNDTDEVVITIPGRVETGVGPDIIACEGDGIQLHASGGIEYTWQPGYGLDNNRIADPSEIADSSIRYKVIVTENECYKDTLYQNVKVYKRPTIDLGPDLVGIPGAEFQLHAVVTNTTQIAWTPLTNLSCSDCYDPKAIVDKTIVYKATVTNDGICDATDYIKITVLCDGSLLFIPNTFTPNDDGYNDRFYASSTTVNNIDIMRVYDRWGQVLFEAHNIKPGDPEAGWDGTYKSHILSPDVYVYYIQVKCSNGQYIFLKGDISLIR
jgi:gliding motility-associated-like protein